MLADLEILIRESAPNSNLNKLAKSRGVRHTPELDRILNLPRRVWEPAAAEALAEEMTAALRQPMGAMKLRPVQAVALLELAQYGGLLGSMRAGSGKSLVTFLAPYVLGAERPVLLVPAKLREKTRAEIVQLSCHFRVAYWLHVLSYEELGRVSRATFLDDLRCDLILSDEAHKLKNPKAAVTRRVRRYVEATKCKFVALSGTVTKRSLQDYGHLAKWSLHERSPLPTTWGDLEEWACALDERPRSTFRVPPGALLNLGGPGLDAVREGFQRRVTETPGVVATYDRLADCSLTISRVEIPECTNVQEAFRKLRDDGETPDGWPTLGGLDDARHARELALGFYYRWEPRGPEPWMKARREWGSFVRYVLAHNRSGIDSELQVAQACDLGRIDVAEIAAKLGISPDPRNAWRDIKGTFTPNKEAIWISDAAIRICRDWLSEPGIVWTEHVAFGEALSRVSGVPYAGAGGLTKDRRTLESFAGKQVIASVASSGEGRNLQAWCRNLVASPFALGSTWEQLLARTHRDGQTADEVTVDVLSGCAENEIHFAQARADAQYIAATTGQDQRLGYGTVLWDTPKLAGPVWSKR